jgi:AraC-like DNA-binding protein
VSGTSLFALDWALRGAISALVLLLAGALLRDHGRLIAARLGALFAVGTAAYALCSAAGVRPPVDGWMVPILALAAGNNVVFWALASALFDDAFRLRWWHVALWLLMVAGGLTGCFIAGPGATGLAALLDPVLTLASLGFALLAVGWTLSSWRADLIEGRRRLRLFIVAASALYIVVTAFSQLLGAFRGNPHLGSLLAAVGLLAIAGIAAWSLLRVASGQTLFQGTTAAEPSRPPQEPEPAASEPVDQGQLAALSRLMTTERAYRQEGLTIGGLAQQLGMPEYRLRRLINQALGYRNFNSFLNHYRIEEVKAALADPAQAAVPILTMALDAGFSSLGPFNRAFKAETGLTPSEYRQQHQHSGAPTVPLPLADSEKAALLRDSASLNSKSA